MKTIGILFLVAMAANAFPSDNERSDIIPWCGTEVRKHKTYRGGERFRFWS